MKARIYGIVGSTALLASFAVACQKDPTAEGVGAPTEVILDFSALRLSQGDSATIQARIVDNRLTPLEGDITFSSCDGATATVTPNAAFDPVPPLAEQAVVHAVGANATCVIASAAGAKPDTVVVTVLPTSFAGSVSSTTPQGGDTLTVSSTAALKFNPATVAVTFGGGVPATILSATADLVTVLVPFSDAGSLTIDGVSVTYVPGLTVSLQTASIVTQTGNRWAGDEDWQTAPDISALLPASGQSSLFASTSTAVDNSAVCPEAALGFGSSGPCMMYKFTVAAPTTLKFSTSWVGTAAAPDIDIYACGDSTVANFGASCFEDGGQGATGSLPQETVDFTYPAGTHWFVIEIFGGGTTRNITTTISAP